MMPTTEEENRVLTLAYCRVSTEEQAEEGFSIEGQADKLRSYANLRDLGEVTLITDPGLSGKNLQRLTRAGLATRPVVAQPQRPHHARRHIR
jgi:hypothetical protein